MDTKEGVPSTFGKNAGVGDKSQTTDRKKCSSAGEDFKAIVRPMLSIIFAFTLIICVFAELTPPTWFLGLALSYLGGWPISREVEKRRKGK